MKITIEATFDTIDADDGRGVNVDEDKLISALEGELQSNPYHHIGDVVYTQLANIEITIRETLP